MKRLILTASLLVCFAASVSAQLVASTNLATSAAGGNAFLVLASRASITGFQLSVPSAATGATATLKFYDQSTLAAPYYGTNYVTSANVGRSSYTTNVTSTYVGFNGVTNWYTNSYVYTYDVTNAAATNALSPTAVYYVPAGEVMSFAADLLHTRGIVVHSSTNATVVVNYRTGQ